MKKLIVLSLISMTMFMPQLYSRSIRDLIQQEGMPVVKRDYLDLAGKNLTNLEGLQDIPTIDQAHTLYLNDNQLQMLPGIFNGLHNLQRLILSNNQLQTLPVGIFNGLNNLGSLNLNSNQLQTLPVGIFSSLNNLKTLNLKGNPFTGEFLLTLPAILKTIPQLTYLDNKPVDQALKSYRVYQPKALQEITKEYAMQNLTPEDLEELAETNFAAFDLLPLPAQQKAAIIAKNIDAHRNQLYKLSKEVLDLLPLTPQQRAGIEAQKRQMARP